MQHLFLFDSVQQKYLRSNHWAAVVFFLVCATFMFVLCVTGFMKGGLDNFVLACVIGVSAFILLALATQQEIVDIAKKQKYLRFFILIKLWIVDLSNVEYVQEQEYYLNGIYKGKQIVFISTQDPTLLITIYKYTEKSNLLAKNILSAQEILSKIKENQ